VPVDCPVHVTLRVRPGVPSLRGGALVREWRRSLAEASERGSFRVTHYSLQGDHAHLIVEAHGKEALACGMMSIGARLARAVNRVGRSAASCHRAQRRAQRFRCVGPRCGGLAQQWSELERAHLTLQDRLVKELRLRGISDARGWQRVPAGVAGRPQRTVRV
jgi:REP element-mobilizing transposase RayT